MHLLSRISHTATDRQKKAPMLCALFWRSLAPHSTKASGKGIENIINPNPFSYQYKMRSVMSIDMNPDLFLVKYKAGSGSKRKPPEKGTCPLFQGYLRELLSSQTSICGGERRWNPKPLCLLLHTLISPKEVVNRLDPLFGGRKWRTNQSSP